MWILTLILCLILGCSQPNVKTGDPIEQDISGVKAEVDSLAKLQAQLKKAVVYGDNDVWPTRLAMVGGVLVAIVVAGAIAYRLVKRNGKDKRQCT